MNTKNSSFFREGFHLLWKNFPKISLYNLLLLLLCLVIFIIIALAGTIIIAKIDTMGDFTTGIITATLAGTILVLFFPVLITGYQHFFVKLARKEGVSFKTIFAGFRHFWPIWLTHYFTKIIIFAGTILFSLPVFIIQSALVKPHDIPRIIFHLQFLSEHFPHVHPIFFLPASIFYPLIAYVLISIFATYYWNSRLFFTGLAALDSKTGPVDAIYYCNNISRENKLKIFLNLFLPFTLISLLYILLFFITEKNPAFQITLLILNLFIFIPWFCSIMAAAYVRLSEQFDDKLDESFLGRFTIKNQ